MNLSLLKRPSAFVPVAMSLMALALLVGYVALYGVQSNNPPHDEGAAAHLFQFLMVLQAPIVLFFAAKWLPRAPAQALTVLVVQACAWVAALGSLFMFER